MHRHRSGHGIARSFLRTADRSKSREIDQQPHSVAEGRFSASFRGIEATVRFSSKVVSGEHADDFATGVRHDSRQV